jgi:hypothetical protein
MSPTSLWKSSAAPRRHAEQLTIQHRVIRNVLAIVSTTPPSKEPAHVLRKVLSRTEKSIGRAQRIAPPVPVGCDELSKKEFVISIHVRIKVPMNVVGVLPTIEYRMHD